MLHIAEVPTIDLIDFNYPPWHTAADTLDKLGPDSLKAVGDGDAVLPADPISQRMNTITRTALKEVLDSGEPITLIDVTPPEYYRAAHLPGAKNCCVYEVDFLEQATAAAPEKAGLIVVYGIERLLARLLDRGGKARARPATRGLGIISAASRTGRPPACRVERGPQPPGRATARRRPPRDRYRRRAASSGPAATP